MFSRCISSIQRSLGQSLLRKRYHLLTNSVFISDRRRVILSKVAHEISITFSLSLFLFYICYQLFGTLIFIAFSIYGILFTLYCLQDKLLYQPDEPDTSRIIVATPDLYQLPYETVTIETADHEKLHGYLIKQTHHSNECETLVFFHGNAGNIGHRLPNTQLLYQGCRINILLFDYRGYGRSTGKPSEQGLYRDAQAVYEFVRQRTDLNQEKIIIFGRSLGGAVALQLAANIAESNDGIPLYCVIVENTFTSIAGMAKRLFGIFLLDYIPKWCYKNTFPSVNIMRHIKVPVLFISGGQDELVPPQMMQQLHEECQSSKKQLVVITDGQHNTTWLSYNYTTHISKFLRECSVSSDTASTTSNNS